MPDPQLPHQRRPASHGRRLRAALVGTGGIAEAGHLPALRSQAHRVDLVAAVDTDPARLRAFTGRHGVPAGFATVPEMLDAVRPDLVHLCTPPAAHAADAVACLRAGAWVWVEKPPVLSLAEYDRIEGSEQPGGPYASVVYQHRFGSGARRLAGLVASGALGRPLVAQCVTAWFRGHDYYEVPWRGDWATEGGGPTLGHGIHQMDLLLSVLGRWTEVRAMAGRLDRAVQTEDVSAALVRFAGGTVATVLNSVLSPREESRLRFDLTEATVELTHLYGYGDDDWQITPAPGATDAARLARLWRTAEPAAEIRSSHAAQLPHLLDALERGVRPPASGPAGRAVLELITALYRSAFTGQPVRREELGPHDPFYHHLHGDTPEWAPADRAPGPPPGTAAEPAAPEGRDTDAAPAGPAAPAAGRPGASR
ncbi:Gfo/Idh/MocA family protein [Streptomyces sp. JJ36]|uniref:Gfo/Idh/MocA family protein n=1 Tax=Streptomyces sp. JJ36 TaxID=2736645 RepID=UPI001F2731DC|nr:Gfo/Idh/MocA family oxidoreductase [Streptomyces sp. JJ36]MCF6521910.1 Gfo/Idh/MocA family oxidoreductase [Streptomyces sp. JJ36]